MTDRVNISPGADNAPAATAESFLNGAGEYIADGVALIAPVYSGLSAGPYNGFAVASTSDGNATIETGEASVGGAQLARDTTTTLSLSNGVSGQDVYVGWAVNGKHTVKIGKAGVFNSLDPRVRIFTFDTTGTSTTYTDHRPLGIENAESEIFVTKGASSVARTDDTETITAPWTFKDKLTANAPVVLNNDAQKDSADVYVQSDNAVDTSVVVIDTDGDAGQNDDGLKVRGGTDPTSLGDGDTVLVAKGDGRVGVNLYDPSYPFDVAGAIHSDTRLQAPYVQATAGRSTMSQLDLEATSNHLRINDTGTDSKWYIDQNGDTFRVFLKDANGNFGDHFTIDPNNGEVDYAGGTIKEGGNPVLADGEGVDRDTYKSSSEPSSWTDGDLWLKPRN